MRVPVLSPVMGAVSLYHVDSGTVVARDELVADVESMKINYQVRAPAAGVLTFTSELGEVVGEDERIGWVYIEEESDE